MFSIHFERRVKKYITTLPHKHQKQLVTKSHLLKQDPKPNDSMGLVGYPPYRRCYAGEYRIIYKVCEKDHKVYIILIGRRNDSQVYREFTRLL